MACAKTWTRAISYNVRTLYAERLIRAQHPWDAGAPVKNHGCKDWVELQRCRKWELAGKMGSTTDGRWSHKLLQWRPWFRVIPYRCVGRPIKRWEDDIITYAGGEWVKEAADEEFWKMVSVGFIQKLA